VPLGHVFTLCGPIRTSVLLNNSSPSMRRGAYPVTAWSSLTQRTRTVSQRPSAVMKWHHAVLSGDGGVRPEENVSVLLDAAEPCRGACAYPHERAVPSCRVQRALYYALVPAHVARPGRIEHIALHSVEDFIIVSKCCCVPAASLWPDA
jgi:hypothetical protein